MKIRFKIKVYFFTKILTLKGLLIPETENKEMKCIVTCKFDKDSNAAATVRCKPNSREQNARIIIPGKFERDLKRVILDLVKNVFL